MGELLERMLQEIRWLTSKFSASDFLARCRNVYRTRVCGHGTRDTAVFRRTGTGFVEHRKECFEPLNIGGRDTSCLPLSISQSTILLV